MNLVMYNRIASIAFPRFMGEEVTTAGAATTVMIIDGSEFDLWASDSVYMLTLTNTCAHDLRFAFGTAGANSPLLPAWHSITFPPLTKERVLELQIIRDTDDNVSASWILHGERKA